jgi:hypothetical protein
MGWMTFEKVLSRAAGQSKASIWPPTDGRIGGNYPAISSAKLPRKGHLFHYLDTQIPQVDHWFSYLKNRYTSRNECNGVQWRTVQILIGT